MELLDLRGQAAQFARPGLPVPSFPLGPRGAAIGFGRLDSDFPYLLDMPQSQIEALLASWATGLGAEIRWSAEVTGIEQDAAEVRVTLADGTVERAAYLAGCDGIRSFTRQAAGLPFPGAPNPGSVLLADLFLDGLPMTDAYGDLSDRGMLLMFPFRDGSCRVVLYDYARAEVPVTAPVTLDEVRASLVAITGQDFGPRDLRWSGRYRSESRQVPAYQGERHPVGAAVLALAGRQFRLNTARTPPRRALRWAAHRIVAPLPPVQARLARTYSGLAIRYPAVPAGSPLAGAGAPHPLAGARLPRGRVTGTDGTTARLYDLFHNGLFVLLDAAAPEGNGAAARDGAGPDGATQNAGQNAGQDVAADGLPDQVRQIRYTRSAGTRLPAAALVRPDGYVAWASDDPDPKARARAARAAAGWWCG